jgi:hypothetical protein
MSSILDDTKAALGLASDYTPFDAEIIMHINSVLANLNQLGIGSDAGMEIVNKNNTWAELIGEENRLNHVKSYMYLKVKMLFDPPNTGYVLTAMEKQIDQAEWRITVAQDDIIHPLPPAVVLVPVDPLE